MHVLYAEHFLTFKHLSFDGSEIIRTQQWLNKFLWEKKLSQAETLEAKAMYIYT